ncbi:Dihydrolipoamide acetyltransferase component of pyruvate dehydrogenase complex [Pleodorina starrii]|uniref:Dihydrolipoamide acetyltransferase component of pyruvate dehydrogenase complex n=1 Tax=Pleodorina starrii TaxID=330485 RepID=A0A9W6BIH9_9CHLO|nr:Dihydrolipoamide acetyltransferase component of pyruvate dehydrogenase complex [Pleodorina starrii]GLC65815.1 Dihydrolipoamide acetyltransferase component of pyruvate dehydrogenase complex [Pleodorina starrii]
MNLLKCRSGLRALSQLCHSSALSASAKSKLLLAGVPEVQLQESFALRGFAQLVSFPLAQTGEGISECELVAWAVKPGDVVGPFDKLCDVQSDKAAIEITSRYGGVVTALHHHVGAMVKVGAPLVDIEVADDVQVAPEHLKAAAEAVATPPVAAVAPAAALAAAAALDLSPKACGGAFGANSSSGTPPSTATVTATKIAVQVTSAPAAAAAMAAALAPTPPVRPDTPPPPPPPTEEGGRPQASPAVRAFAKQNGVVLAAVLGTGPGGRITRGDVVQYLEQRQRREAAEAAAEGEEDEDEEGEGQVVLQARHFLGPAGGGGGGGGALQQQQQQRPGRGRSAEDVLSAYKRLSAAEAVRGGGGGGGEGESRVVPLRGYRRAMVGAMTAAAALPTFHLHDEVAMDRLLAAREVMRGALEPGRQRTAMGGPAAAGAAAASAALGGGGLRLTVLPLIIKALSAALSLHPHLNASLAASGTDLLLHPHHNIGVAMATPTGLVVPNIKQVERKSVAAVAAELALLQQLAAAGRLPAEALRGGSITISNIGTIGGTYATPLVSPPEVAIVALGRMQLMPRYPHMNHSPTAAAAAAAAGPAHRGLPSANSSFGGFGGTGSGRGGWNESSAAAASAAPVPVSVMPVSWGADHRVVDGAALAAFNNCWREFLEQPERLLLHLA